MADKKCNSTYAWIVLILAVLWLIGAVFPKFGQMTYRVPWFQLIIIAAAIAWINCCKK